MKTKSEKRSDTTESIVSANTPTFLQLPEYFFSTNATVYTNAGSSRSTHASPSENGSSSVIFARAQRTPEATYLQKKSAKGRERHAAA